MSFKEDRKRESEGGGERERSKLLNQYKLFRLHSSLTVATTGTDKNKNNLSTFLSALSSLQIIKQHKKTELKLWPNHKKK